jgi:hypothetical protein
LRGWRIGLLLFALLAAGALAAGLARRRR